MYRVQILRSLIEWDACRAAWDSFLDRTAVHFPVHQSEPLSALARHFFDERHFAAVLVWDGPNIVAGVPLVTRRQAVLAPTAKTLANDWSPRGCLLIDPSADAAACSRWLLDGLRQLGLLFAQLDWLPLADHSVRTLVAQWNALAVGCWIKPRFEVGRIDVPADWDAYVATWSRNRRKKMGQLERQLERHGAVNFVEVGCDVPELLTAECRRAFAMEHASWKGQQRSSILSTPAAQRFFEEFIEFHRRRGSLRLQWLTVGDLPIAFDLGTLIHGVFTSYKISYLPEWAHYSPGQLLLRRQLEDFSRRGEVQWIDCLGVLDEATQRWTTRSLPMGKIVLSMGSWLGNHAVSWMAGLSAAKARWR